jgi:hypothetical protein
MRMRMRMCIEEQKINLLNSLLKAEWVDKSEQNEQNNYVKKVRSVASILFLIPRR